MIDFQNDTLLNFSIAFCFAFCFYNCCMNTRKLFYFFFAAILLSSCQSKFDKDKRLLVENLTSSSGGLSFKPMMRSDSVSVKNFTPDTFFYKAKPFTGAISRYNEQQKIQFTGFLKNGLADSAWKFYYATGGLRLEGNYVNGMDVGLWRSYYGYGKPKIDKYYDKDGYMLMRIEYFDNGHVKNYQNVKCAQFGNKERSYNFDRKGDVLRVYVEDSVLLLKRGEETERIGENVFATKPSWSVLETVPVPKKP